MSDIETQIKEKIAARMQSQEGMVTVKRDIDEIKALNHEIDLLQIKLMQKDTSTLFDAAKRFEMSLQQDNTSKKDSSPFRLARGKESEKIKTLYQRRIERIQEARERDFFYTTYCLKDTDDKGDDNGSTLVQRIDAAILAIQEEQEGIDKELADLEGMVKQPGASLEDAKRKRGLLFVKKGLQENVDWLEKERERVRDDKETPKHEQASVVEDLDKSSTTREKRYAKLISVQEGAFVEVKSRDK